MNKKLEPVHPGDVLSEDFMKPLALSQNQIARDLGVPPRRINEIVLRKRRVTADTALRLATYFKTSPQFWMNLQSSYDLDVERVQVGSRIAREVHACSAVK
jgi:addiction module HigA family antidote